MYLTIISLPIFASILSGLFGRKLGVRGAQLITTGSVMVSLILGLIAFYEVALLDSPVTLVLGSWLSSDYLQINWGFNFDSLTVSMFLAVLVVSFLVHIYSISYMENDPHQQRFFSYLSMFTSLMLILITADNYLLMFVGWEGVGISSFLLISFWFTRLQANTSALSAILYNRCGDYALTVGLFSLIATIASLDYTTLFALSSNINEKIIFWIGLLFLIGSMAKSAQVGLHAWLPQAMEGPTPVSALIHAATMVTAGIYLLIRSSPFIEYSSDLLLIIFWLGAITALFAGLCGLFMNDIKRIIAYSTMSQLGYMAAAIGMSSYNVALFHLINHAFFKASLFMAAGAVIHSMGDNQSLRKYGGLMNALPLSSAIITVASFALVAAPYTAGFYSKELLISMTKSNWTLSGNFVYWILTFTALFTLLYSVKLMYYTFLSQPNGSIYSYNHLHESNYVMSFPLIVLGFASIFSGYLLSDLFVGLGNNFLNQSIFVHPDHLNILDTEFGVSHFYKLLPSILTVLGIAASIWFLEFSNILPHYSSIFRSLYSFFNQKFYFELIVNNYIILPTLSLGYYFNKSLDRGAIELVGPYGLTLLLNKFSAFIAKFDTGLITNYALYLSIALITYIIILFTGNSLGSELWLIWFVVLLSNLYKPYSNN